MLIKINGENMDIPKGSTIKEAIELSNAPYSEGSIVCLIKGESEIQSNIFKYNIKTPKGSIRIELDSSELSKPLTDFWKENYSKFVSTNVRWDNSKELAIGPLSSDFKPSHEEFKYYDNEVLMSLSGFSNDATHVIFIKDNHTNVYGVPESTNRGVFARVIGGRKTLFSLNSSDEIISIEPIIERSTVTDSTGGSNLEEVLQEGNQLFTYVLFEPNPNSPESVEHFFSLIRNNKIDVSFESNSFVGFYELNGLTKIPEEITERKRGTVTLRNDGKGKGRIYVYREDRVKADTHTNVAKVKKGIELFDIAKEGDSITVRSNPERVMLMMMSQKEAEDKLNSLGLKHIRNGKTDDDAIIVAQEPECTINILNNKEVSTYALDSEDLLKVKLTDKAPRSRWYFEKITGLAEKPVGTLKVYFAVPDMNIFMFEGDSEESKGLIPENIPENMMKAGEIGITNMSKKNLGYVGIRTVDNAEFGPTGETFQATNVVGAVVENIECLNKLKDGSTLYVYEVYDD